MTREDLHFRLRIPDGLKKRIEIAAGEQHRSMTSEIVARLEASFLNYMQLSGEGLEQVLKSATALSDILWEMMVFVRDVELDGYITDMAKTGHFFTREQAIASIVREYLSERGYVVGPPNRRPGLEGFEGGTAPFDKLKALMGDELGPVIAKAGDAQSIALVLESAARDAVNKRLAELEAEGLLRRSRYPTITRKKPPAKPVRKERK